MNIFSKTLFAATTAAILAGCTTPIADLKTTEFDRQSAPNEYGAKINKLIKAKYSKKLRVGLVPSAETSAEFASASNYMKDKLSPAVGALTYFSVIPLDKLGTMVDLNNLASASGGETKDVKVDAADFLLVYKIVKYAYEKDKAMAVAGSVLSNMNGGVAGGGLTGGAGRNGAGGAIGGGAVNAGGVARDTAKQFEGRYVIEMNFSLFDVNAQTTIEFEVSGNSDLCAEGETAAQTAAFKDAVDNLIGQLASKFGPPGRVLLTKGEGSAVQINQGKKLGVRVGTFVDFFEYIADGEELIENPIASGKVAESDAKYLSDKNAWVRVDQPKIVKKNTLFRLRGNSK